MIRRLVMVEREQIERVGPQEFITIDGVPTPILRLDRFLPVSPESGSGLLFLILPEKPFPAAGRAGDFDHRYGNLAGEFRERCVSGRRRHRHGDCPRPHDALSRSRTIGRIGGYRDPRHSAATAAPPASKGRILLVEDTQFFRELIGGYLKSADYEVTTAVNGAEALRIIGNRRLRSRGVRYRNARHGRLGFRASRAAKRRLERHAPAGLDHLEQRREPRTGQTMRIRRLSGEIGSQRVFDRGGRNAVDFGSIRQSEFGGGRQSMNRSIGTKSRSAENGHRPSRVPIALSTFKAACSGSMPWR